MKKIILIISVLVVLSCAGLIYALEVEYPTVGGMQGPQDTGVKLTTYIRYIYNFAIISGGLIALLALIYGGFRFLTSAGNPSAITDAREQILAGLLGLVVILGSYIILNELNPDLVSLRIPGIDANRKGIILYSQAGCGGLSDDDASMPEVADIPDGLLYKAMNSSGSITDQDGNSFLPVSLFSFQDSKDLIIQFYSNDKCEGNTVPAPQLNSNQCLDISASNLKCIKFIWYKPGVWVFNQLENGANVPDPGDLPLGWEEGKEYIVFQSNQESLPNNFHDQIVALVIVPSKESEEGLGKNYGVIAHNIPGPMLKEKGWAHIYLPGNGSASGCRLSGEITKCGPFENNSSDISSLTIFNMPKEGTATKAIKVCRNDRCEPQRVGDDFFDVYKEYFPGSGLQERTSVFGGAVSPYNLGSGIVYGKNLNGENWDTGNPIVLGRNQADGVSAIEIDEGARYLTLLYDEYLDFSNINTNTSADAAIINISMPSLRTIQMDGRVGTIIVIRVGTED